MQLKKTLEDPNLPKSIAHLQSTLSRLDRLTGGGGIRPEKTHSTTCGSITDNLRDLTEDAKRYPSRLLLGAPPPAGERPQP